MNRSAEITETYRVRNAACWRCSLAAFLIPFAALPLLGQVALDEPSLEERQQHSGTGAPLRSSPVPPPPLPKTSSIVTLDPDQLLADIRDIRGPVLIPNPWLPYLVVTGVVAVLALITISIFLIRGFFKRRPAAPVINPYDQALSDLRATRSLISEGLDKEFSSAVSDVVRFFLERQFSIPAPESTTEEFLIRIRDHNLIKGKLSDTFSEFLQECDLAKFARHAFGLHDMNALYGKAKVLIEETYLKHKMQAAMLAHDPSEKPG